MGTATSPARSRATNHGMPASTVSLEKATAPMAAKPIWHRDTWPEVRTSRLKREEEDDVGQERRP